SWAWRGSAGHIRDAVRRSKTIDITRRDLSQCARAQSSPFAPPARVFRIAAQRANRHPSTIAPRRPIRLGVPARTESGRDLTRAQIQIAFRQAAVDAAVRVSGLAYRTVRRSSSNLPYLQS